MDIQIESNPTTLGLKAASVAVASLQKALHDRGEANLILATGASQFEMLQELVRADVDWKRVTCFHLDEYIGLPATHPASFRGYLQERFVEQVEGPKEFHWVGGRRCRPNSRMSAAGRDHPATPDRRGLHRNRREWPSGFQRPSGGLRDDPSLLSC